MLTLGLERGVEIVALRKQQFAELKTRFRTAMLLRLRLVRQNLETCEHRLVQVSPRLRVKLLAPEIERQGQRLKRSMRYHLVETQQRLAACNDRLNASSPLAVLARGYSVVEKVENHKVVSRSCDLVVGERLRLRFNQGAARCQVESIDVGE
jgi:exodeoxyribonuclease VII large subunit